MRQENPKVMSFGHPIAGIAPPVFTLFDEEGRVDTKATEHFIGRLNYYEVDVVFALGGSGEFPYIEFDQKKVVIDACVSATKKPMICVPNVGCPTQEQTIELGKYAQRAGADGIGVVLAEWLLPDEASIVTMLKAVDAAVDIPIMIYDPAGEGPRSITPQSMVRLLEETRNIRAMKYRTVDDGRFANMSMMTRGLDFNVMTGAENVYLPQLSLGGRGVIGGGCNIYPNLIRKLEDQFFSGEMDAALETQFRINRLLGGLDHVEWPMSGKLLLRAQGFPLNPVCRKPIKNYTPEGERRIIEAFEGVAELVKG